MKSDSLEIRIHQALHGYSAGHRRLVGSLNLPSAADRLLSVLSDLSGPALVKGYDSYITGYPLPESDYYVLARTWYAAEMPRPGSVWTHSLLLSFADLAHIVHLDVLTDCFRRPKVESELALYEEPLSLVLEQTTFRPSNVPTSLALATVEALYGDPKKPVFVVSTKAAFLEQFLIQLWSQQWPRLRREFRFCSGSIEDRAEQGVRFDLQVIPPSAEGKLVRQSPDSLIVRETPGTQTSEVPAWVSAAIQDLQHPLPRSLRGFFHGFAADVTEPRSAFAPLANIFVSLSATNRKQLPLQEVISRIAAAYARPKTGRAIKRGLLGPPSVRSSEWVVASEAVLLGALVRHPKAAAFDPDSLEIGDRAKGLYHHQRREAISLFTTLPLPPRNQVAESFASACMTVMSVSDIDWKRKKLEQEGLLWALSKAPKWLLHAEPWKALPDLFDNLIDIVEGAPNYFTPSERGRLAVTLLSQGWDEHPERLLDALGPPAVEAVLEFADKGDLSSAGPSPGWLRALSHHPQVLLERLAKDGGGNNLRWLTAAVLEPEVAARKFGPAPWVPLTREAQRPASQEIFWRAVGFMYAVGLISGSAGSPLIAAAFAPLHEALAADQLPHGMWQFLKYYLPPSDKWREWDRCSRLRRSIVDAFLEERIEFAYFTSALANPSLFETVLKELEEFGGTKKFSRKFREAAERNPNAVSPQQQRLMNSGKHRTFPKLPWEGD